MEFKYMFLGPPRLPTMESEGMAFDEWGLARRPRGGASGRPRGQVAQNRGSARFLANLAGDVEAAILAAMGEID